MMEFELKTNSWHFWVANFATMRVRPWRENDICSYTRAFIAGSLWLLVVACLVAFGVIGTGFMLYDIFDFFMNGANFSTFGGLIGMIYTVVIGMAIVLCVCYLTIEEGIPRTVRLAHRILNVHKDTPPSFLALAYRKFKDKTCFKIKFKDE